MLLIDCTSVQNRRLGFGPWLCQLPHHTAAACRSSTPLTSSPDPPVFPPTLCCLPSAISFIMPAKKTTTAGPSYLDLAKAAIVSLKERNGSSLQAIKKFVMAKKKNYVNGVFLRALKSAVAGGKLVQVKGSYKLAAKAKAAPKKKAAPKVRCSCLPPARFEPSFAACTCPRCVA